MSSISTEELFYLQTRGMSLEDSYINIINGFIKSQIASLPEGIERDKLDSSIDKCLQSLKYEPI